MIKRISLFCATGAVLLLTDCAGVPGESPEHMRMRMERQDTVIDNRQEKRKIRSEAADRRYDQWWDNATGSSSGSGSQNW